MTREDVKEFKFDNLEGMLEDLWNATQSEDWHDVPSYEMTLGQAQQAVRDLRKKLAEYLEQKPCEDAISRVETIKYLNTNMAWYNEDGEIADSDEKLKAITDLINGVPSVTPQPIGHWIDNHNNTISCDRCHTWFNKDDRYGYMHYCPNCRAKMQEVEE